MSLTPATDDANRNSELKRLKASPDDYDANSRVSNQPSRKSRAIPYPQDGGLAVPKAVKPK